MTVSVMWGGGRQRRTGETPVPRRNGMETPGRIEDRRLRQEAAYRVQWLRERRLSRALVVDTAEFWEMGNWLQEREAAASSQRADGNMLKGDGVGGSEGCGLATGCQVELAMVGAILKLLMKKMDERPGQKLTVAEEQEQGVVGVEELRGLGERIGARGVN